MADFLDIQPLTKAAFAPFGDVIEADPATMRHINNGTTERFGSGGATTVTGSARSMLGWLTGRSAGGELQLDPAGPPPTLPPWG